MAPSGWPFWAATDDERIDRALEMAGLQPGETLLDLGCGDGRVLLRAAALIGAVVVGVELDPALAASARDLLKRHDVTGTVIESDFAGLDFEADDFNADVVFAYLSPATLQRLRAKLAQMRSGTRIVTTGYAIPGWDPVEAGGRCFLYRLPAETAHIDRSLRGWGSAGVLVSLRPDAPSLVGVKLHHAGGDVDVRVAQSALVGAVTVRTGADRAQSGDEVVVDLRFEPQRARTVLAGALDARGEAPFQVFAVADEGQAGVWGLSQVGCDEVGAALSRGDVAAVLDDARSSSIP